MIFHGVEICCPDCKGELEQRPSPAGASALACQQCGAVYPVILGIPDLRLFPDPYLDFETDRRRAEELAAEYFSRSFEGLAEYYYQDKHDVPPAMIRQYLRGILSGPARSAATLDAWTGRAGTTASAGVLLEVGCGTGPLLRTAAERYPNRMVGVDIGLRWLVLARKRLEEAGLDVPLFCACAEALPFPDGAFERVAAENTLENLSDQAQALGEFQRVLAPGGQVFISTPNRYSLGPDPHIGLPAGGYLPKAWVDAYVRRQGGIPPKRRLLSAGSLGRLLGKVGFSRVQIFLPDIPAQQKAYFSAPLRFAVDVYQFVKRLPLAGGLLRLIGPTLLAVAQKPAAASGG